MPAVVRAARALKAFDLDVCREQVSVAEEGAGEEGEADRPPLLASTAVIRAIVARMDGDLPAAESALATCEAQLARMPEAAEHQELLALLLSSVGTVELWTGKVRRGRTDPPPRAGRVRRARVRISATEHPRPARRAGVPARAAGARGRTGTGGARARRRLRPPGGPPHGGGTPDARTGRRRAGRPTGCSPASGRREKSVGARHDPFVGSLVPMLQALRHADGRDFRRALSSLAGVPAVVRGRPLPPWLADRQALTWALVHTERRDTAAATAALDKVISPERRGRLWAGPPSRSPAATGPERSSCSPGSGRRTGRRHRQPDRGVAARRPRPPASMAPGRSRARPWAAHWRWPSRSAVVGYSCALAPWAGPAVRVPGPGGRARLARAGSRGRPGGPGTTEGPVAGESEIRWNP